MRREAKAKILDYHSTIADGWKGHEKNQQVKIERERRELAFEKTVAARTTRLHENRKTKAVEKTEDELDWFEKNMKRLGGESCN